MLRELRVTNLGVIEEVDIEFGPGMNVLSGETGAGKTLVVEAIKLLTGGRADLTNIRHGAQSLRVEGRFETVRSAENAPFLELYGGNGGDGADGIDGIDGGNDDGADGIDGIDGGNDGGNDDGADGIDGSEGARFERQANESGNESSIEELILSRQIPKIGRSRAWINAQMAATTQLKELSSILLDIQGQHEHMSLLTTRGQREALDSFANIDLSKVEELKAELTHIRSQLDALGGDPDERIREIDFLQYQIDELNQAAIFDPNEEESLELEEENLSLSVQRREAVTQALMAIGVVEMDTAFGPASSATDSISSAITFLSGHSPFEAAENLLIQVSDELSEVTRLLRTAMDRIVEDPQRLEEVRSRRQFLFELARKYGGTLDDARNYYKSATERLEELKSHASKADHLKAIFDETTSKFVEVCNVVQGERKGAAPKLAMAIEKRLADLAMPRAKLTIEVGDEGAGDEVSFSFSANPGEVALPLSKVASGGELARTALACRLLSCGGPETLIFDEVDAGVGGGAATYVGKALAELSKSHQVIVVTHLAQVAAFADHHLTVTKQETKARTVTHVHQVSNEDRVVELSRMMSGQPDSLTARKHAAELLDSAKKLKTGKVGRTGKLEKDQCGD